MKTTRNLLLLTLILSTFNWFYFNYLYEELYLKYLPNYRTEVEFPVYSGLDGKQVNKATAVSDDMKDYLPIHGKVTYYTAKISIVLIPFLFISTLLLTLAISIHKWEKIEVRKWALIQAVLFSAIYILNFNTNL